MICFPGIMTNVTTLTYNNPFRYYFHFLNEENERKAKKCVSHLYIGSSRDTGKSALDSQIYC